ncbi:hypothetical protein BJV82DRAFT_672113 [Fennellomyces sp. T-0311]|nr:hypothetical protein BJV82DRAFT_672113 [Fennellomyces sp. T-0311]
MPQAKRTSVTENRKATAKKKQKIDIDAMAIDEEPPAPAKRGGAKKATTYKDRTAAAAVAAKKRKDKAKEGRWSNAVDRSLNDGAKIDKAFLKICKAVASIASRDLVRKELAAPDLRELFLPGMAIPGIENAPPTIPRLATRIPSAPDATLFAFFIAVVTVGRSQVDFEDDGHLIGQATKDFDFVESKRAYMTLSPEQRREVFYYAIWRAQALDNKFFGRWAPEVRALRVAGFMMFQRGTDLAVLQDEFSDTEQ